MFSKIGATVSNKYHIQLQRSIYCCEKSEGATIGILLKKTCNFIRKRLQYCEVLLEHQKQSPGVFYNKSCSYKFRKIHRKTPVPESLSQSSCRPQVCSFIKKETLTPVFSCEFCEIYKNTFFTEHLFWKSSVNSCFWKSASQWQISRRRYFLNFFISF